MLLEIITCVWLVDVKSKKLIEDGFIFKNKDITLVHYMNCQYDLFLV